MSFDLNFKNFNLRNVPSLIKGRSMVSIFSDFYKKDNYIYEIFFLFMVIILVVFYFFFVRTPIHLPQNENIVKITIPEGYTIYEIAKVLDSKFTDFDKEEFLRIVKDREGYLYPETYFFFPDAKENKIAFTLYKTFYEKTESLRKEAKVFGRSFKDVIIMASILEKEASNQEDRRIISGILWKRIDIGMPLQVDAAFLYINGKNTYELTLADLKIGSPYNTYKKKGLPYGPIANPGEEAIMAAIRPVKTDYLFYLSDKKGNMYYANTFEEHKKNKILYIK